MPVTCPHCQGLIELDPQLGGREVSCPHCNGLLIMPGVAVPKAAGVTEPPNKPADAGPLGFLESANVPRGQTYGQPKNTGVAACLSFLWTGLGQIYNGQIPKGILLSVVAAVFLAVSVAFSQYEETLWLDLLILPPALGLWVWGIFDAYKGAEKCNSPTRSRTVAKNRPSAATDDALKRKRIKTAQKKRIAWGVFGGVVVLLAVAVIVSLSGGAASPDKEAEKRARAYWNLTRLNGSYYVCETTSEGTTMTSKCVFELRDVKVEVFPESLTEADKLNGWQWAGSVYLTADTFRSFTPQPLWALKRFGGSQPKPDKNWSAWKGKSDQGYSSSVRITKVKGKWELQPPTKCDSPIVFKQVKPSDLPR